MNLSVDSRADVNRILFFYEPMTCSAAPSADRTCRAWRTVIAVERFSGSP
jgi:hypothetical protein